MGCLESPKWAFAGCWVGLWENHLPKLSVVVTQEDCTCRPELCKGLSNCLEASEPKEMWHKIFWEDSRAQGAQSSRNSLALPPWEWEVDFPTAWMTKVGSGDSVQLSAIHMLIEKFWRGLFIQPCKFLLSCARDSTPGLLCGSQPAMGTGAGPNNSPSLLFFPSSLSSGHREGVSFERKRSNMRVQGIHLT